MSKAKHLPQEGRIFLEPSGKRFFDLSGVRLIRCAVDTVRQLYIGLPRPEVIALFDKPGLVDLDGFIFHASRIGRDSGYQYKLQNNDLGLILLFKSFHAASDSIGNHLKIEVSPHCIESFAPDRLQELLDRLASACLTHCEAKQCAVHLALDLQGWTPPADLTERMHCRARAQRRFDGLKSFEFDDKSATYSNGQSFLWGSAGSCQLAIYNKTLQAQAIDKLDYWRHVWRSYDDPFDPENEQNYDDLEPVWRVEFRFHHSVIEQFAQGSCSVSSGAVIDSRDFKGFSAHLDGLWQYGLKNFQLRYNQGFIDAFWSVLSQEVRVETAADSLSESTIYKRYYKTASGFSGKNVDLLLGNAISLAARERLTDRETWDAIRGLPFWQVILDHYKSKGLTPQMLRKKIKDSLAERIVRYGMAV